MILGCSGNSRSGGSVLGNGSTHQALVGLVDGLHEKQQVGPFGPSKAGRVSGALGLLIAENLWLPIR